MTYGQFDNGLRYAVRQSGSSVAYCAMSIRCGTAAEAQSPAGTHFHEGTAHFCEHTIFKGTSLHNAAYINSCLDRLGGELNAYTTKEEIVLHATVLKEDLHKAAGLLFELSCCPTFPDQEIEMEKGVVIDEIAACKDSPSEEIYDRFEELFFSGNPLGRSILGNPRSVRSITSNELSQWVKEFFVPENMAFTIVSPLPEDDMIRLIQTLSDRWLNGGKRSLATDKVSSESGSGESPAQMPQTSHAPQTSQMLQTPQTLNPTTFDKTVSRKGHQVNCIMGVAAPSLYGKKKRIAAVLLSNILGGLAGNSILNSELREKHGLVYNVECSYTQYSQSGIIAICFGCDKENVDKCKNLIRKEIGKLQAKPFSEAKLKAAKKQLIGQMAISGENGETQCLTMGKSLLAYGSVMDDDHTRKVIEEISVEELSEAADELFREERTAILTYL